MSTNNQSERGLRILSFDHGGPGTYSQLLIIKRYMDRLAVELDVEVDDLYPADWFDVMGGVGFGGLAALMLGHLKMTIDEAIGAFVSIASSVFLEAFQRESSPDAEPESIPIPFRKAFDALVSVASSVFLNETNAEANMKRLKRAVEAMLQLRHIHPGTKMNEGNRSPGGCKVALWAVDDVKPNNITIFRTYSSGESSLNPTIVQALCATIALPPFFSSIKIRTSVGNHEFVGPSPNIYNPTRELLREVAAVFGNEVRVAQILSLGSGCPRVSPLRQSTSEEGPYSSINRLTSVCEREAQDLSNRWFNFDEYLRISVDTDTEDITLEDWNAIGHFESYTDAFLETITISGAIDASLRNLRFETGRGTLLSINHLGRINMAIKTPPPVCPYFVIREKELKAMKEFLVIPTDTRSKVLFLTGRAGSGKTQLVSYFLQENWSFYTRVVYLDASSVARVNEDLRAWARSLGDAHQEDSWEDGIEFLFRMWQQNERWALILDGADDPALNVGSFCRGYPFATIIVTSQNQHTELNVPRQYHLEIGPMSEEEAVSVILLASQRASPMVSGELTSAKKLARELHYLPIWLAHAGSYCRYQLSITPTKTHPDKFAKYLTLLEAQRAATIKQPDVLPSEINDYTILDLSYAAIPQPARAFLHLASQFHYVDLPVIMLLTAAKNAFEDPEVYLPRSGEYRDTIKNLEKLLYKEDDRIELQIIELIRVLCSCSLVSTTGMAGSLFLQLHPLVHVWLKNVPLKNRLVYEAMAQQIITSCCRDSSPDVYRHLFSHLDVVISKERGQTLHVNDRMAAGKVMSELGHHYIAEKLFEESLELLRHALGEEDRCTFKVAGSLSGVYMKQRRWDEAEKVQTEILERMRRVLGNDHLDTLNVTASLAATYHEQARWQEASRLQMAVLDQRRQLLAPSHPDVLDACAKLAASYCMELRFTEAEELALLVLEQRRIVLRAGDPSILSAAERLASIYRQHGRLIEAETLQQEALEQWKQTLGMEHPHTLEAAINLAEIYEKQGKYDMNEQLMLGVLETKRRILGESHPRTITATEKLASAYHTHGKLEAAADLLEDVLDLKEMSNMDGQNRPDTITTMKQLAAIYQLQGELDAAEEIEKKVRDREKVVKEREEPWGLSWLGIPDAIRAALDRGVIYDDQGRFTMAQKTDLEVLRHRMTVLGKNHPDTLSAAENLASTYHAQEQSEAAEALQEWVTTQRRKILGVTHPHTIRAMKNLATIYTEQYQWAQAERLQQEVMEQQRVILGTGHPRAISATMALAATYSEQEKWSEAEELQLDILEQKRSIQGKDHAETIGAAANLASTYHMQEKWKDAAKLRLEILDQRQRILGKDHPYTVLAEECLEATRRAPKEIKAARDLESMITGRAKETNNDFGFDFDAEFGLSHLETPPNYTNDVGGGENHDGPRTRKNPDKTHDESHVLQSEETTSIHTRLAEESQRVVEHVHLCYREALPETIESSLLIASRSHGVQLVALNFELPETSIAIDRYSTFRQIGLHLRSSNRDILPVALEQLSGPLPRWRIPDFDSKVPRGLPKIYVVDISAPFTLALVRDVKEDFPLLLPLALFGSSGSTTTVADLIGTNLLGKMTKFASIRLLSNREDIQGLSCDLIQSKLSGLYSTSIFVLSNDDPLNYKFRNDHIFPCPPPLKVAFLHCKSLVHSAPKLDRFGLPAIHLSRALLHLMVCLSEAVDQSFIDGSIGSHYISRMKSLVSKLKSIFMTIENVNDATVASVGVCLWRFFRELCEEQPGVVSVRQSLESLQALMAADLRDQGISSDISDKGTLVEDEDLAEQDMVHIRDITRPGAHSSASSDSLTSSGYETSSS